MTLPQSQPSRPVPLYLEAVPPSLREGEAGIEAVLEKIRTLHQAVGLDGVNIPEIREESSKSEKGERINPFEPRVRPRDLALRVRERLGLECMINRVVVHLERRRQADWFRETWEEYGVRRFVLVGGEKSGARYPGPTVPEANELIRKVIGDPGLRVGNICIPTRRDEALRMARKMETGTDFFTTQIIYHANEFTGLLDELAGLDLRPPLPMVLLTLCPAKSARNLRFLHWLGVSLSPALEAWLTAEPERVAERSLEHIGQVWHGIAAHRNRTRSPFPVGLSLAPIGRIPPEMTVSLAERLIADSAAVA